MFKSLSKTLTSVKSAQFLYQNIEIFAYSVCLYFQFDKSEMLDNFGLPMPILRDSVCYVYGHYWCQYAYQQRKRFIELCFILEMVTQTKSELEKWLFPLYFDWFQDS